MNGTDPSGNYGRGTGWTDKQWKKFDKTQKKAAKKVTKVQTKLRAKAAKLRGKEEASQKDIAKAETLETQADSLNGISDALNSDGSDGYTANVVDGATWTASTTDGGLGRGADALAFAETPGKQITFNGGHSQFLGGRVFRFSLVHEASHNTGHRHQLYNGIIPYKKSPNADQRAAYKALLLSDPRRAMQNPDNIAGLVY